MKNLYTRIIILSGLILCIGTLIYKNQDAVDSPYHILGRGAESGKGEATMPDGLIKELNKYFYHVQYKGELPLPMQTVTKKRNDHRRFCADKMNIVLEQYHQPYNVVLGFTSEDIGLDDFRGYAHYGIRGMANGIGKGVAVFSNYRGA